VSGSASDNTDLEGIVAVGDVIAGRYVVDRVIGAGGMGVVVAARHETLGKPVAVKFLHPKVAALEEPRERFLREARAAVDIRSEHVARVTDVGALDSGAPYMVMEYLEGRDLDDTLAAEGPLHVDEALELVLQACEALAEAHARGLVHRDVKPANLFVTHRADGSPLVKLLDFGISRAAVEENQQRLTATHAVLGTPTYMAPEQLRAARNADARTDVWAIGATLHELLCGAPPFQGETVTALTVAIMEDQPTPLGQLVAGVPEDLEAAVLRCLEKKPERRFPSIAAFVAAIRPLAPASAQTAIDMIMSVDEHGLSDAKLTPEARRSRGGRRGPAVSGQDDTLPGYDPGDTSPELARTSAAATGLEAGSTQGSWQAGKPPGRGVARPVLGILLALCAVVAVIWLASSADEPAADQDPTTTSLAAGSTSAAATTAPAGSAEPPVAPQASGPATATATASASSAADSSATVKVGAPPGHTGRPPKTPFTGKVPAPSSEAPVDPIGDRK